MSAPHVTSTGRYSGSEDRGNLATKRWEHTRTENQLKPFEGFRPEEIGTRASRTLTRGDSSPTMQFAKPPEWTETPGIKCEGRWEEFDDDGPSPVSHLKAAELCSGCPVIERCLSDAMEREGWRAGRERGGIRGGVTARGRYALYRRAQRREEVDAINVA